MDNLETLIGSSTFIPEMDEENQENRNYESSINFDGYEIIDKIGTKHFKMVYLNLIDNIKGTDIRTQIGFCRKVLNRIIDVYEYEYMPTQKINSQQDVNAIYDLIEFLEYDHIEFFANIWTFLDDIEKVNLNTYCKKNIERILIEIEDQIDSNDFNELISIFLRTNNKENILRFVIKNSEEKKMLIKLRIMEKQ